MLLNSKSTHCLIARLASFGEKLFSIVFIYSLSNKRYRVPVIKTVNTKVINPFSSDGNLSCDICFNNKFAVENSELILNYTKASSKLRELMLLTKCWAKRGGISNAADGTPSR